MRQGATEGPDLLRVKELESIWGRLKAGILTGFKTQVENGFGIH